MRKAEAVQLHGDGKYDEVAQAILDGHITLSELHLCGVQDDVWECPQCRDAITEVRKAIDRAEREDSDAAIVDDNAFTSLTLGMLVVNGHSGEGWTTVDRLRETYPDLYTYYARSIDAAER